MAMMSGPQAFASGPGIWPELRSPEVPPALPDEAIPVPGEKLTARATTPGSGVDNNAAIPYSLDMSRSTASPNDDKVIRDIQRESSSSLTQVTSQSSSSQRVHIGFDDGTYETKPLCGALKNQATETTDEYANCPACKKLLRKAGADLQGLFDVGDDYNRHADRFSADYDPSSL